MNATQALDALRDRFRRVAALQASIGVLGWDRSTLMPKGGAEARAEQMATLSVLAHELMSESIVGDWLALAENGSSGLDPWQAANLREMRRLWTLARAVPADLVDATERANAACEMRWRDAREQGDFGAVASELDQVVLRAREVANARGAVLGLGAYDALLDEHDEGLRDDAVEKLFDRLTQVLPPLLERILEADALRARPLALEGPFPVPSQRKLAERLMRILGFDFAHGRLDTSHHPFTGGVPEDVRITTRWDEADFASGLMAVLHETGHALYELGLPKAWRNQPVGRSCGMTIHESQSLLIEMQACRTQAFVRFLAPVLRQEFETDGPAWDAANLLRHYRRVERSFIRVDADEVTYPLHVILRHRLERALIAGSLAVRDLPEAWNASLEELLGIRPSSDREGCLQDIHWYSGAFGYFPTYTLGALTAAQLFETALAGHPELPTEIAEGRFETLLRWLRTHVHGLGRLYDSVELTSRACGRPLDTGAFERHLEQRYLAEAG